MEGMAANSAPSSEAHAEPEEPQPLSPLPELAISDQAFENGGKSAWVSTPEFCCVDLRHRGFNPGTKMLQEGAQGASFQQRRSLRSPAARQGQRGLTWTTVQMPATMSEAEMRYCEVPESLAM